MASLTFYIYYILKQLINKHNKIYILKNLLKSKRQKRGFFEIKNKKRKQEMETMNLYVLIGGRCSFTLLIHNKRIVREREREGRKC